MIYLVDGSNVLGRAGANREAVDAKRELLRAAVAFARSKKVKVRLFFDGPKPDGFAADLGAVRAFFSGAIAADELISAATREASEPVRVVTSDRTLAARVQGRRVSIETPREFLLGCTENTDGEPGGEDWESYFSDPKNRERF